jgi:hypothetical protein
MLAAIRASEAETRRATEAQERERIEQEDEEEREFQRIMKLSEGEVNSMEAFQSMSMRN